MPNTNHIEISRFENTKIPQTVSQCVICKETSSISDCADEQAHKSSNAWFAARHEQCGVVFRTWSPAAQTNYQGEAA